LLGESEKGSPFLKKGENKMSDVKYMEYRLHRLESTIEYVGGFSELREDEKEEYKRLRAYLALINKKEEK
jgi:hypothetical protein